MTRNEAVMTWRAVCGSDTVMTMPPTGRMLEDFATRIEAAERGRCIETLGALKNQSGVNDDGQTWLRRLTRGDCLSALEALGPNA